MPLALALPSRPEHVGFRSTYNILDYGTSSALHTAMASALSDVDSKGGGTILIPRGTHTWGGEVKYRANNPISIIADKGAVLDGTTMPTGTRFLWLLGKGQDLPVVAGNLSADATAGSLNVTLDFATSKGDILQFSCYNYSVAHFPPPNNDRRWQFAPSREYYTQGEFNIVEVGGAAGTSIQLRYPLRHSYVAVIGTEQVTKVYKLKMPRFVVQGLHFSRPAATVATYGLRIESSEFPLIQGCTSSGANTAALQMHWCLGGAMRDCEVDDAYYNNSTSSQCISVSSCENVRIENCETRGGRGGISVSGGQEPNRYIHITGCRLRNLPTGSTSQRSLDFHANCEDCLVENSWLFNGVIFNARNLTFRNNYIYSYNREAIHFALEVENTGILRFVGNKFQNVNPAFSGAVVRIRSLETDGRTYTIDYLEFADNIVEGQQYTSVIHFNPSITIGSHTINIGHLRLSRNKGVTSAQPISSLPNSLVTVNITKLEIDGVDFRSTGGRAFQLSNITSITDLIVRDSYFEGAGTNEYVFDAGGNNITNIDVRGCHFKGAGTNPVKNRFYASGRVLILDNVFENFNTNRGLDATAVQTSIVHGNRFINCTGTPILPASLIEHWYGADYATFPAPANMVKEDPASTGDNTIQPTAASVVPLIIRGAASQTGNLLEFQNSAGAILTRISSSGYLGVGVAPAVPGHFYRATGGSVGIRNEVGNTGASILSFKNTTREWYVLQNSADEFAIRDVTATNVEPFKIKGGGAPTNSFYMNANGRIGIGLNTPAARLEVTAEADATPAISAKARATQAGHLLQITDSAGAILFAVEADGDIRTSRATAGTTLGSVVKKLALYDAAGTLLGYLPIYDNIT